ncbi:MAG: hypothetical protein H6704_01475 [Myxococcales bacterium]|nr:hypothetical protein [Myxococcales bacterium]MCB9534904.1 hypothetical protein [Myxococcales bacterium]
MSTWHPTRPILAILALTLALAGCGINTEPIPGDQDAGFSTGAGGAPGGEDDAGVGAAGPDAGLPPLGVPGFTEYMGCDQTVACDAACPDDLDCEAEGAMNPIESADGMDGAVRFDQADFGEAGEPLTAGEHRWYDLQSVEGLQSFHAVTDPPDQPLLLVVYDDAGAVLGRSMAGQPFVVIDPEAPVERAWLRVVSRAEDDLALTVEWRRDGE